jgi:glycosyltransferase involved in cell wall biosynthesis
MRGRVPDDQLHRGRVEVWPTLPTIGDEEERSLRWMAARSTAYLRRARARLRAVERGGFDICHVRFLNYFTDWFDLRALARRTALVFEVHDVRPHQSRLPAPVEQLLLRRQYRSPGSIIVRHDHVREQLVHEFAIDPADVTVVPLQIGEVPVPRAPRPSAASGVSTILCFGTLRRNKGIDVLLHAIESLRGRDDLRFVFAGRGYTEIERSVHQVAERDPRVLFDNSYISSDDKHAFYGKADLVALPYTEFGSSSGALSDAYAHGVPVVVSDVGVLGDAVRAERTGWVVPRNDHEALAQAIVDAIADPDARRRAIENEASVAAQRTPAMIGALIRAVYERARAR